MNDISDKLKIIIFLVFVLLLDCRYSFAEGDSGPEVNLSAGSSSAVLNVGFSQWTLGAINFHETATYINSNNLGNITGIDVGAGIVFLGAGVVLGYNTGNNYNPDPHMTAAFYPEIKIFVSGYHDDGYGFGVRYYVTSDHTHLTTFGIAYSWGRH
jgi:hypothetical protein